jgi:tetratricopeptide (TPR) repeat protein/tRNA A-37 threonylcarbamoyl transferase component Bud32
MICSACGFDAPGLAESCPRCSAKLSAIATAVLTPPPAAEVTRVSAAGDTSDDPATSLSSFTTQLPLPSDDGRTVIAPARAPDEARTFVSSGHGAATVAADVTRLADAGRLRQTADSRAVRVVDGQAGPLRVGQAFGPRYHIIRELGVGGMGAVYQAWDAELGVVVAIKVIRPEVMADPGAAWELEKRFKRELLLARQVTHKNVVRIHDLGEIDGIKYITMSFVDGIDLATLLKAEGTLPVPRALAIIRSVVAGLAAAHSAGVVHRDLKPANVMVPNEGDALIMDFGIARSTGASANAGQGMGDLPASLKLSATNYTEATMAGSIVGTVQYMAPEQARGEEVDQRADLYALGLIAYDMLAGRQTRKHSEGPMAELRQRMEHAPKPIESIVPDVPQALSRIVARCIEPDPAARFQTTTELVAALDELDDRGVPLPRVRRLTPRLTAAAVVGVLAMLGGTYVVTRRAVAPVEQPDPVAIVIADLANRTGDPAFERTLEPMLRRALEGAGFISAYDRNGIGRTLGTPPPEVLDETAARAIAVKEGLGFVLSGAIESSGAGYDVSVRAIETVTGNVIANARRRASGKDQVLQAATGLMATVRNALGDDESESAQLFAMASLSANSLEVVRLYAEAQDAGSSNRFDEAKAILTRAIELDPDFGVGYYLLGVVARNTGNVQEAEQYVNEALKHLDGMTERERYSTRGMYYRLTGDYRQCVAEYGEMVTRFSADVVGRNQRALCMSQLRDMRGAMQEMQSVVDLLPNRALFRDNLALYANYAGDFQKAEQEARAVPGQDAYATLALAFAQLGQAQTAQAGDTYRRLATMGALGESLAASGLGDIAAYEGRYTDAVRVFEQGSAVDLKAGAADRAAAKLLALAHVRLLQGRVEVARAVATQALEHARSVKARFLAGRIFAESGDAARTRTLMEGLAAELQAEPQAYAKILGGQLAVREGNARQAIQLLTEANTQLDTWIGHFELGRAYLEAGAFPQADSEFDRCTRRRGEALALFLDEEPTFAYLPPVYYYQGRAREGLKTGFADAYKSYLAIRGGSTEDPLLPEVRRRIGG